MLVTLALTALAGGQSVAASVPPSSAPIPAGYTPLVDDTGAIVVAVPDTWTDIDTAAAVNEDGSPRPYIAASPDLASFLGTFDTPGVLYAAFPYELNPWTLMDAYGIDGGCETVEVKSYDDPVFIGIVQVGTNCGAAGMTWNMVVASTADHSFTALVQVQTAPDDEAMQTVLLTFNTTANQETQPSAE